MKNKKEITVLSAIFAAKATLGAWLLMNIFFSPCGLLGGSGAFLVVIKETTLAAAVFFVVIFCIILLRMMFDPHPED